MATIPNRMQFFLNKHELYYETIPHRRDFTAQETAAHTHTPGREFAKTVVIWVDGNYAMAVLPAHHIVDFEKLSRAVGAQEIKLASEYEIRELCPDCEEGAMPPFGNLYDMPVYVSTILANDERITFNAGSHSEAIRMYYVDFANLAHPKVIDFSKPM